MPRVRGAGAAFDGLYFVKKVTHTLARGEFKQDFGSAEQRVLPYLDVPFQHSHPDVLKRMKRPASGEKNLERLQRWGVNDAMRGTLASYAPGVAAVHPAAAAARWLFPRSVARRPPAL